MFDKILNAAENIVKENIEKNLESKIDNDLLQEEDRMRKNSESWVIFKTLPSENDVYSIELLNIIKKYGFEFIEYSKRTDCNFYEEYAPAIEFYSLKYKNYKFLVRNLYDVDIPDGIFAVYDVTNINSNERIKYYVDLGCRNTTEIKLNTFLLLLDSESKEDFLNKRYFIYKELAVFLKKHFTNFEDTVVYESDRISGYLRVDNVFVIPYLAWMNEIKISISNTSDWNINSSNSYSKNKIGYYVNYTGKDDFDIILGNIEAMKKHINGEYGFFEKGTYYKNDDINKFLNKNYYKDGKIRECFNHYLIRIETIGEWDFRGYSNNYINIYNGLELAKHFKVSFNDAAQWSIGEGIGLADIIIKYDKKIDKDNCILQIRYYQYNKFDDYTEEIDEDEIDSICDFSNDIKKEFLVDEIEFRGSFLGVMTKTGEFLNSLCKIFNIEEVF